MAAGGAPSPPPAVLISQSRRSASSANPICNRCPGVGPAGARGIQQARSASRLRELLEFLIFFYFIFLVFFLFLVSPSRVAMQELLLPWLRSRLSATASGGCGALRAHLTPILWDGAACHRPLSLCFLKLSVLQLDTKLCSEAPSTAAGVPTSRQAPGHGAAGGHQCARGELPGPSGSFSKLLFSHLHINVSLSLFLRGQASHWSRCHCTSASCQGKALVPSPLTSCSTAPLSRWFWGLRLMLSAGKACSVTSQ